MTEKICVRCGQPVKRFKDEYEVFENMHWICFHFEFEHGEYDLDEPCDDPSCPWNIREDYSKQNYVEYEENLNIISIDRKSIIAFEKIEEDIKGFGINFKVMIKDIDFGWIISENWIEKHIFNTFIEELKTLGEERKGKAFLQGMSPNELEINIENYDNSGHIKVDYLISKNKIGLRGRRINSCIRGEFEIDLSHLKKLVKQSIRMR
ncbi:hypothetical protein [Caloranaerobacter ferrireducens]|uniref:hypothetical protein n=1 Tax=Caloranaerobacter ferrireducens TaxID=1323370 RepID=UPI00084D5965|nr:hypothetical protein [Caloranaerobacter ferrireducens]